MRLNPTKRILLIFSILFVLCGCEESQRSESTKSEPKILLTKENAKGHHVDMYLRSDAYSECNRMGRKLKVGKSAANVTNNHHFIVQNEEKSIKAILVCEHGYSERLNMWAYASYDTETKPVHYIMSKKHDENNKLIALKLLEKRVIIK
ncbi:hypothetical protein [Sporosarcina sp. FSL W7-1283]|uniref:hypothetical protein n=1 Tax=Sporosarcina sp. FSL W7-1283 TaxID=2921560 RepID=UPI0030F64040